MICGRWEEPNRRVRARDPDGKTLRDWITFAPRDADARLRERLERKGYTEIQISAYDFQEWKEQAQRAAEQVADAVAAGEKPSFHARIWGSLKQHLFDISDGRCAYCEARVQHVDYGDVEHYRPKSAVKEDPGHGGYYWLAYDPTNLLPSCGLCNKAPGKVDQFPVLNGTRVVGPESRIEDERPLLFNPYSEDPRDHLKFLATGDVRGKTEQGEQTIVICRLQRLREQRRSHMERFAKDLQVRTVTEGSFDAACISLAADLRTGQDEYCNALSDHLLRLIDQEAKRVAQAREVASAMLNRHG